MPPYYTPPGWEHSKSYRASRVVATVIFAIGACLLAAACFGANDLGLNDSYFGPLDMGVFQPAKHDHHSHHNHYQSYQPVFPPPYFNGAPYGDGYYSPHGWYAYPQIIVVPPQPRGMWVSPGVYGRHYYRF